MYDCGFMKEGNWFRYRAGGIIIKDHKMLFVKSAIGGYYYMMIRRSKANAFHHKFAP